MKIIHAKEQGKNIFINMDNVTMIQEEEKGVRFWFTSGYNDSINIDYTSAQVSIVLGELENEDYVSLNTSINK